jgi:predicted MFS family arabinose efflux permease
MNTKAGNSTNTLYWALVIPAAVILMITMGVRQSTGLFVSPINTSTGLGIASISFALAIGQFMWGVAQPVAGAFADRYGAGRVLVTGICVLALGMALTPFMTTQMGLIVSLGVLAAVGSGAGSFSILIGSAAQRLAADKRSSASGLINAGGSLGQFIFAPIAGFLLIAVGWQQALLILSAVILVALPFVWPLRRQANATVTATANAPEPAGGLKLAVRQAFRDKSYLCLHAGFFTCGFHIAFLITHLPQEIALCHLSPSVASWTLALIGIANIIGSIWVGRLGNQYRMKYLLFWLYLSRAVMVMIYLFSPKTDLTFYIFAFALGITWLSTVPPTAGLVGKLFGVRYLATLFGLTLLSHQIGGFLGAWLGGLALENTGSYLWMWYADAVLAVAAALINLPIKEKAVQAQVQAQ